MSKRDDERSIFDKDDTYDRMYFGKGGCGLFFGLFLAVIVIIYIIYNIIVNS